MRKSVFKNFVRERREVAGAGMAIIWNNGTEDLVLYVKERSGLWGLPKGHSMQGEDISKCACREILEELDIVFDVQTLRKMKSKQLGPYKYFFVRIEKKPILLCQESELTNYHWFSGADMKNSGADQKVKFNFSGNRFSSLFLQKRVIPENITYTYPVGLPLSLNKIKDRSSLGLSVDKKGNMSVRGALSISCKVEPGKISILSVINIALSGKWRDYFFNYLYGVIEVSDSKGLVFRCNKSKEGVISSAIFTRDRSSCAFSDKISVYRTEQDGVTLYAQKN